MILHILNCILLILQFSHTWCKTSIKIEHFICNRIYVCCHFTEIKRKKKHCYSLLNQKIVDWDINRNCWKIKHIRFVAFSISLNKWTNWEKRIEIKQTNKQIKQNKKCRAEKIMELKRIEQNRNGFSNDMTGCEITHVVQWAQIVERIE